MPLPASFARDGLINYQPTSKYKRLMIGTQGETNTGKTEFINSAPGPGVNICIDRAFEGMLDNPNPPAARRDDFAMVVIKVPLNLTETQDGYKKYFEEVKGKLYKALENADARTVALDCDSDFYELQQLATFGRLTQIWPQTRYSDLYALRKAITARAWDSGKIIIGANKVKDEYETVLDAEGKPTLEADGKEKRTKTGRKERQGYKDTDYLWQIQIEHFVIDAHTDKKGKYHPSEWGIRILKCKNQPDLKGLELTGEDCNFAGLVQVTHPDTPLKTWGF